MKPVDDAAALLSHAAELGGSWVTSLPDRRVVATRTADQVASTLGGPLPDGPTPAREVIDLLAAGAEPGLTATGSGRFFGFVLGGALPVGAAADVLTASWDQNCGIRALAPAALGAEDVVREWTLDLLGLPRGAAFGLVPGGMSANFTCLAAARHAVLERLGWDVERRGLAGAPPVHVLVSEERHETIDRALRFLGLGEPSTVAVDGQGRIKPEALADALDAVPDGEALIVCLYGGHIHSGDHDRYAELIPMVHARGGWVHVDGAIGLWAAASERLRPLTAGMAAADSWSTDAHKTLNVPFDCGMAIVADPLPLAGVMMMSAAYLVPDGSGRAEPPAVVPEWSRRGRAFPVWAVLRHLGRSGVDALVTGLHENAVAFAEQVAGLPGVEVLHDVVATQLTFAVGSDERADAVVRHVLADGRTWISGSTWHGRRVVRVSVSSWATDAEDVALAVQVLREALDATA